MRNGPSALMAVICGTDHLRPDSRTVALFTFNLLLGPARPTLQGMFDNITAELATATDKLAHLRRFL